MRSLPGFASAARLERMTAEEQLVLIVGPHVVLHLMLRSGAARPVPAKAAAATQGRPRPTRIARNGQSCLRNDRIAATVGGPSNTVAKNFVWIAVHDDLAVAEATELF
jgi:hypothetical protein